MVTFNGYKYQTTAPANKHVIGICWVCVKEREIIIKNLKSLQFESRFISNCNLIYIPIQIKLKLKPQLRKIIQSIIIHARYLLGSTNSIFSVFQYYKDGAIEKIEF